MSLRFPYQRFKVKHPIPSLAERRERPRPILAVTLIGPAGSCSEDALLDTGSDDTLFPEALATVLGIDLSQAPTGSGAGFGMHAATVRYAEVTLRIADNQEQRQWKAHVGFTSAQLRQPLLGYAGGLQFFTATFHGEHEEVELTVNATYPGS